MSGWRVVFAPEAVDQIEALFAYIASEASVAVARRYVDAVIDTCERLQIFPLAGVARDDIREGLRVTHHRGRTVIAYRVDTESRTVAVVGLFHGGQEHERRLRISSPGST